MMMFVFTWSPDTIWILSQKVWWFLIVLGVLISFHELGHFLAARWVGVKVLKFSLGFGPKLAGRQIGETEYLVSAVPLGGYVKLFGEEEADALTPEDRRRSFAHQRLLSKMLIVAAGPVFNFLLAYLIIAGWLSTGAPLPIPTFRDLTPVVEAILPGSPADLAGIRVGDRIIRINDKDISTRNEVFDAIDKSNGKPITFDVRRGDQVKTLLVTPGSTTIKEASKVVVVYHIGIEEIAPVITAVMSGSPATAAGFKDGDRVVAIEGKEIHTWSEMTSIVKDSPSRPLHFQVKRDGQTVSLTVTPVTEKTVINGKPVEIGKIGISAQRQSLLQTPNFLMAPILGLQATWDLTQFTLIGIYKIIAGEISSKNIGGPLAIANVAGEAAAQGTSTLIYIIAILSINLGVLNLLPIPILDGGHLFFFAIEAIRRKPMAERQREIAQQVGLLLLVSIMVFAFWNDIERLISN